MYLSKKPFTYEIYAGTSKAAHKVFQQTGTSSIREFSLLHNLQFFARKIMAEDWVRLQLGVLRYFSFDSPGISNFKFDIPV